MYPRSFNATNLLGINYALMGKPEDALQEFNWTIEHSPEPTAFAYSNKAQALMSLGRFDEAKKVIEEWQQKGTLFEYQKSMLYRIAYIENDTATMDRLDREAAPDDGGWMQLQMQFAYLRGDIKKFRALSDSRREDRATRRPGARRRGRSLYSRPARSVTRKLRGGSEPVSPFGGRTIRTALASCGAVAKHSQTAAISPTRKHWRRNSTAWHPKAPSNRKFICR